MKVFEKSFKFKASFVILVVFLCLAIILLIWFIKTSNVKLLSLLGSLFGGLIVAIIQFIIALQDYIQTEKLKELELIRVMYDRNDRNFYGEYISKAKQNISILGVRAKRFFMDFADHRENAPSSAKYLLQKLEQGVDVKILLPNVDFLDTDKKNDFEIVRIHIETIKKKHPNYKLTVKYFEHVSVHSIFIVDDTCIVGPVFPKIDSQYTPGLQLKNISPLAVKYIAYFNDEWENANE
jgi:hypothetical protein